MKRYILLTIVTLIVGGIFGSPLYIPKLKTSYDNGLISAPAAKEVDSHRERRSYRVVHNYLETIFDNIQDEEGNPGKWIKENCQSSFNCGTVSSHYCNNQSYANFYCSDNYGK